MSKLTAAVIEVVTHDASRAPPDFDLSWHSKN
jgi:hypothetical protein